MLARERSIHRAIISFYLCKTPSTCVSRCRPPCNRPHAVITSRDFPSHWLASLIAECKTDVDILLVCKEQGSRATPASCVVLAGMRRQHSPSPCQGGSSYFCCGKGGQRPISCSSSGGWGWRCYRRNLAIHTYVSSGLETHCRDSMVWSKRLQGRWSW